MSRNFENTNRETSLRSWYYRGKYQTQAYSEFNGLGGISITDFNFHERINYGTIDHNNYSVYPNKTRLVSIGSSGNPLTSPQVFDFVADAVSNMRMNLMIACQKGMVDPTSAFGSLEALEAYSDPRIKYDSFIGKVMDHFNKVYIPKAVGVHKILTYKDYVNTFLNYMETYAINKPVTFSRFQKSNQSSILNTGLAFTFFDINADHDQAKIDEIIDNTHFEYFKNLCLNMGFHISKNRPNLLVFDIASPAARPYLLNYGLINLDVIFDRAYLKTYIKDIIYLYNNINIYYNNFVVLNPVTRISEVQCRKTVITYVYRKEIDVLSTRFTDKESIHMYTRIRNIEEGQPLSREKISQITKKAHFLLKKFDIDNAMGYISSEFKDQVWNKNYGYDDLIKSLNNQPTQRSGQRVRGEGSTQSGGSSGTY